MITLRQAVTDLMVAVHGITPELAAVHAGEMTEVELAWRFERYMNMSMEMELSAASANPRRVNVSSTRLFTPLTATARTPHSALFPCPRPGNVTANSLPESEKERTGSEVGGGP